MKTRIVLAIGAAVLAGAVSFPAFAGKAQQTVPTPPAAGTEIQRMTRIPAPLDMKPMQVLPLYGTPVATVPDPVPSEILLAPAASPQSGPSSAPATPMTLTPPGSAQAAPAKNLPATATPATAIPAPGTPASVKSAPIAAAPVVTAEIWRAQTGKSLRSTLTEWASRSNWSVVWNTDNDFVLRSSAEFEGPFTQASGALLEAFATATPPVFAEFYNLNRTIVVTTPSEMDAQ